MTDVQRAWLNLLLKREKRDTDMQSRAEATRQRVFARGRRR